MNARFDLIYLESAMETSTDQEAAQLIQAALKLLDLNGFLYFREACTQKSKKWTSRLS